MSRASVWAVVIITAALGAGTFPALAQEQQEFPGPDAEAPLEGYTRNDGTVVLSDESFCRFLLGSLWGDERLTYVGLIDKSKKQKKAKAAAFAPASDEDIVARCVDAIGAYRSEPTEADTLVSWARRSPVVPQALASLLPDDFEAQPLAQPDEIGPAARTSGYGDQVSAPFEISGGTWLAEVDDVACDTWAGALRNARDMDQARVLQQGREYLYDLAPGHYYWDVAASGCDWSVDLVPVELGPDPNATPLPKAQVPKLAGSKWQVGDPNPEYLTAAQARQAILDAGLTVGKCTEKPQGLVAVGRVWGQEPPAGTLLERGSPVNVLANGDCDVVLGDRVIVE